MSKYIKGSFMTIPNKDYLRGKKSQLQTIFSWICEHADEKGICFPTRKTLAEEAGVEIETLDKYLNVLIADGVLVKTNRKREGTKENTSNLYQIMVLEEGEEGLSGKADNPSREKPITGYREKPTETQSSINSNHLTSENKFSQSTKITFEEFMSELGKEIKEKTDDSGNTLDVWCHNDGKAISKAQIESYKRQHIKAYGEGIDSFIKAPKKISPVHEVFYVFKHNPAKNSWFTNRTQRTAASDLLDIMPIEKIRQLYEVSQEIQGNKKAPTIDSPYEMLNNLVRLYNYVKGGGNVGVV